jgi:hypothetical protein
VVRSVDDLVQITGKNGTLLICLNNGSTAGLSTLIDTTLVEVISAEVKTAARVVKEMSLRGNRVGAVLMGPRVSHGQATQGKDCKLLEMH